MPRPAATIFALTSFIVHGSASAAFIPVVAYRLIHAVTVAGKLRSPDAYDLSNQTGSPQARQISLSFRQADEIRGTHIHERNT